jgi:hypothetical protein
MNSDFSEMLSALSVEGVEYPLVGAYAIADHGVPRATGRPRDCADADQLEEPK